MGRTAVSGRFYQKDYGTSLSFSTAANAVLVPTTSIDPTTGMTVACWIKLNSLGPGSGGRICDKHATAAGYNFLCNPNNILQFQIDAVNSSSPSGKLPLKVWVHVAGTYDKTLGSNQMATYINGVVVANGTNTSDVGSDGAVQRIGNRGDGTRNLDGKLDEFRFYTRGLSAEEIALIYAGGEPSTSGLVQYYKCDEGSGTSATDSSGNSNTGTITSATYTTDVVNDLRTAATGRTVISL